MTYIPTNTALPWDPWQQQIGTPPFGSGISTTGLLAPKKIRLLLSEVEKLREVVKGDEDVKKILQKFTPHIEIEVDFE